MASVIDQFADVHSADLPIVRLLPVSVCGSLLMGPLINLYNRLSGLYPEIEVGNPRSPYHPSTARPGAVRQSGVKLIKDDEFNE